MDSTIPDPFANGVSEDGGSDTQTEDNVLYPRIEIGKEPKLLESIPSNLLVNSPASRALLCINTACFALTACQGSSSYSESVQDMQPTKLLKDSVIICSKLNKNSNATVQEILRLPMFSSRVRLVDTKKAPARKEELEVLLTNLQVDGGAIFVEGANDTVMVMNTHVGKRGERPPFIMFNPRCRQSPDLSHASLFIVPDHTMTAQRLQRLFTIISSAVSREPERLNRLNIYHISLKRQPVGHRYAILPVYESNLHYLNKELQLQSLDSIDKSISQNIGRVKNQIEAEKLKEAQVTGENSRLQAEIIVVEQDLRNIQQLTDSVMREQATTRSDARTSVEAQRSQGNRPSPRWGVPNSHTRGASRPSENAASSSGGWWPSNWNSPLQILGIGSATPDSNLPPPYTAMSRSRSRSRSPLSIGSSGSPGWRNDDAVDLGYEEALRLQAQFAEEEQASFRLAQQLEEQERTEVDAFKRLQQQELRNQPFDCSICTDTYPVGDAVSMEQCKHALCRGCVLQHIKSQVTQARWPIFCPMCPNNNPRRGVISRWTAEIVGADDALFEQWNRMELAGVSISVECPRCKKSTAVDAEDFRLAKDLDCPQGCGAHWCKNCHREYPAGATHSCDGEAEFNEMVQHQKQLFRRCPKCGTMIEKNGGCDHMKCTAPGCNTDFSWGGAA